MPKNINNNSRKFPTAKTAFFSLFTIVALLIAAFPKLYEIKTKAGIDISPGRHAGTFFEKHTNGLFKCEWLYPYHCDPTKS